MNHLENKYIYLLSNQLEGFKKIGHNYNFRCPICGDSATNKRKKRGWILSGKDSAGFYCHNCNASMSFQNLLKTLNPTLHREYVYEILKGKQVTSTPILPDPDPEPEETKELTYGDEFLSVCTPLSELHQNHPAVEYLVKRKVPIKKLNRVYWMDSMQDVHKLDKVGKYKNRIPDEDGRIVFPQWTPKSLAGMSCRSIDPKNPKRYLIFKFDERSPLIYGLYDHNGKVSVDRKKVIYVTEGAVDSLFLDNAIAVNGSDLPKVIDAMSSFDMVYVPDNEPRNKQIVSGYNKIINKGARVVILPKSIQEKDINEMVLTYGIDYIKEMVEDSIYDGLKAKLKLTEWRRC